MECGEMVKGWCPQCLAERRAFVLFEKQTSTKNTHGLAINIISHRMLECAGCEAIYFQNTGIFREISPDAIDEASAGDFCEPRSVCFPRVQVRRRPIWIDDISSIDAILAGWLDDIYFCFDHDKNGLAAIAIRTVVDRTLITLGVDKSLPFSRKVQWAIEQGHVLESERSIFENLFDAGSAATHRGWQPGFSETITLIVHLEAFLHRTFVLSGDAEKLRDAIPPKND